jgi:hypothetical protein
MQNFEGTALVNTKKQDCLKEIGNLYKETNFSFLTRVSSSGGEIEESCTSKKRLLLEGNLCKRCSRKLLGI